jgi:hypothetical protein
MVTCTLHDEWSWDELISGLEVYQVVNLNMSEFHSERSTV